MRVANFSPGIPQSTSYAMSADDIELHFEVDKLRPRQAEELNT